MALFRQKDGALAKEREEAFNRALDWSIGWSDASHSPIGTKLAKAFPRLRLQELNEIHAQSQEAIKFGHELAYALCKQPSTTQELEAEFHRQFKARYPCASDENARRLFREGLYYALKTGTSSGLL